MYITKKQKIMNIFENEYKKILKHTLDNGVYKEDRTGVGCYSTFKSTLDIDVTNGFPCLTGRKIFFKNPVNEFLWMLNGENNTKRFVESNVNIWNSWADKDSTFPSFERLRGFVKIKSKNKFEYSNYRKIDLVQNNYIYNLKYSLFNLWQNLINTYYNDKDSNIFICEEWLNFDTFYDDISTIPNWDDKRKNWDDYILSIKYYESNFYSKNTCVWLHKKEEEYYQNNNLEIKNGKIQRLLFTNGNLGKVYGYQLRNFNSSGHDQLLHVLDQMRNNPNSRRHLLSMWNPLELGEMNLPSCHYSFQFVILGDELNLIFNMRSVDLYLGLPYNITCYALWLHVIANELKLKPKMLSFVGADCHIYSNQIKSVEQYLNTKIHNTLPTLEFNKHKGLFQLESKDFKLLNYKSGDHIFAPVAV